MYIEKTVSVGDLVLKEEGFGREVFLEGFLLERLHHICPPGTEASDLQPLNQLHAPGGAQTGADGRVDIAFELRVDEGLAWAAVEIKAETLTIAHLNQLLAYLDVSASLGQEISRRLGGTVQPASWIGILVGPSIDPDLAHALVRGIWSNLSGVRPLSEVAPEVGAVVVKRFRDAQTRTTDVMTDKYFCARPVGTGRDYSRFSFDGGETWLGASAFVRAFIASFVSTKGCSTLKALRQAFPKTLQGSMEVVLAPHLIADRRRYSSEVFHVGLESYAVCTQWGFAHGQGNLLRFIDAAKRLGAVVQRRTADGTVAQL